MVNLLEKDILFPQDFSNVAKPFLSAKHCRYNVEGYTAVDYYELYSHPYYTYNDLTKDFPDSKKQRFL